MTDIHFAGTGSADAALANARSLLSRSPQAAVAQAREILRIDSLNGDALRILAAAHRQIGDLAQAEEAERDAIKASAYNPVLVRAAVAIRENRLREAEHLLRPYLASAPDDAAALRMLAEIAARLNLHGEAEKLLNQALAIAPSYASARSKLARLLTEQNRYEDALKALDTLIKADTDNVVAQGSKAALLSRIGEYEEAIALYEELLKAMPGNARLWMSYGHILKTVGRIEEGIAAYRHALRIDPTFGEVWWSLANLKTVRLGEDDVATMRSALEDPNLNDDARLHINFALGKALEDRKEWPESFARYTDGNRIRRDMLRYEDAAIDDHVHRCRDLFSSRFFEERQGQGAAAGDPIFIIGMPRAGSTLIEQILSSHSAIEGTSELPHVPALTSRMRAEEEAGLRYPEDVANLGPDELQQLGIDYLNSARFHRKTSRPFFIDKLPNNWLHVGFIHVILPNVRIIDARRHPLACCFSNFKQHFAQGQAFSYSLEELGRYYRHYVSLLDHFDRVLPGRIHRVIHERLIDDPETEIRRLLDHLGLPFETSCLRFYENERAVRTPSAEQVRRPINRDGVERWKHYEPWLDPLKQALGSVLSCYPDVPEDL